MARLKLSEWLHLAPDKPSRIRENHQADDCDGGRDSMIIERKEDGSANAYCFRCGRSGFSGGTRFFGSHRKEPEGGVGGVAVPIASTPPDDASTDWGRFPRDVREWLLKGGVTSVIASEYGFLWSDSQNKLWIEARQYSKVTTGYKVSGYAVRGFSPKSYLTRTKDKDSFYGYYVAEPSVINNTKIVLVEDLVSAIKVSQVVDCIAIMGVHPKASVVSRILSGGYSTAFVFLDGDNPTVRMKAREIGKRLPFVRTHVIEVGCDPKACTKEQIEDLIR